MAKKHKSLKKENTLYLVLAGIAILIFLTFLIIVSKSLKTGKNLNTNLANPNTVEFQLVPLEKDDDTVKFKLVLDTNGSDVSFVKLLLDFDPEELALQKEVDVSESAKPSLIFVSPMITTNTDGEVELIIANKPNGGKLNGKTELATLTFTLSGDDFSEISLIEEDTQVLNLDGNELPILNENTSIVLGD